MASEWLNGKPFVIDGASLAKWKRIRRTFGCLLCGHEFEASDTARFVFCNFSESPYKHGNFFVCQNCDDTDENVRHEAAAYMSSLTHNKVLLDVLTRCAPAK